MRELLVIEDDPAEQLSIAALIGADDIRITARRQRRAKRSSCCATQKFDCVILDLKLPDISGFELLSEIQRDERLREIPIVVFTGPRAHARRKRRSCASGPRASCSRACRARSACSTRPRCSCIAMSRTCREAKQRMIEKLHESDEPLRDRKVLVVDDDVRNIFALNSLLERHGMNVITATNGQDAIKLLDSNPDLSLVLMDVMMPEMDGYETMRRIRENPGVPHAAHHRADRQGHEGRPREMPAGGRVGLRRQTREHRPAAVAGAHVAAAMNRT